ncbi:class I SAM-dependent methyltransferase [Saccharopolyspora sp. ASAGF58]|uniref:class I SAM-dependent methyltransferase n=1 Tax=Saccharopolyspora sp. ASAGF58 TaxID=2719023 RepID=UPI00143FF92F|nr:class I SAM-dependent methyltransferase [Saccharopolyspora sp. ASAGF58]QIZ37939.1 class I SAM-dependent methyltransferase [Saccharopolyspora sp. ASAGF58]
MSTSTDQLPEQFRTRPGTPMMGPYSTNQMDDFYAALHRGEVKASGLMNLMQHLIVAEQCAPGAKVLDVCCGRGLALPLLRRYTPEIERYVGLDISSDNLNEARERIAFLRETYGELFPIELVECDVAQPWPQLPDFDVALYTSALEHLPFELGSRSLHSTAQALAPGGMLFLSTPATFGPPPRPLQYRVHVYEWSREEVEQVVGEAGLVVDDVMGLLPPEPEVVADELTERYGQGAANWYRELAARVPRALLDTVSAVSVPKNATELLYVCRRPA